MSMNIVPMNATSAAVESDINTRPMHVTFFRDEYASTLRTQDMTLPALRDLILKTTASTKAALPWLKLAKFGDKRTEKNSLRNDANVDKITGIELDDDSKTTPLDEAVEIMERAKLRGLLYTSPSSTEAEPKSRILLPTSCDLPPNQHAKLIARVNGLFGGIFSTETFTLSQSYYFGTINNNPAHCAVITDGDFIDLRGDLDAGAIGKRERPKTNGTQYPEGNGEGESWSVLLGHIHAGTELHTSLRDLAWRCGLAGMNGGATVNFLRGALENSIAPRVARWQKRYNSIPQLVASAEQKIPTLPGGTLIQSSAEFASGFTPPDYQIDGLIQRRFLYAMTGPTGAGKTAVVMRIGAHVALGLPLDGRDVEKARVLFFAGENPDDIRMRWIKLCEEMGHDPADMDVFFLPGTPPISDPEIRKRIDAEVAKHGEIGLLIVDTSAAYFRGDDENSNALLGAHARMLRSFVNLPGGPTVIVTCHPTKNPSMDNLLPRGGGAFIAEVDGNLVCMKNDAVATLHWHGKFRGPDFAPIPFQIVPGTTEKLKDSKGQKIWTVTAKPITESEVAVMENTGRAQQDAVLLVLQAEPTLSLALMAEKLRWFYKTGEPNKSRVHSMLKGLIAEKLIKKVRGLYVFTEAGEKAAKAAKKAQDEIPF